ncbi:MULTISPECIES: cysteine desulfurase family protein [unclassified Ligilactobacillus]|uniref:cysteine desulfurase family protein n=1 Tax=unclassified Ligilactobacillus TaxID=2767920 RepID=UPI003854EEEA
MIYFDNSATTKVAPEVLATYDKVSQQVWGNPSSLNALGMQAHNLLEQARHQIADLLGVADHEIFFTSGGSEGDNWVIKGTAMAKYMHGKHLITSSVEHPAVLSTMAQLERLGFDVTYLPVDHQGRVRPADLKAALRSDTILVSIMAVNNEVGAIEPINELAAVLRAYPKVHFHVDAVQALGKGVQSLFMNDRVDFVSFSGHKFHAPRGVGFVYKKSGRKLEPLITGGGQEKNQRSSTENLPAIVGMARAMRLLLEHEDENVQQEQRVRQAIFDHISSKEKVHVFSAMGSTFAPHILTFAIEGVRGETVVHAFEHEGIYLSTTSACSSKDSAGSGTLSAMGVAPELVTGVVRISLDGSNTLEEAHQFNAVFDRLYERFKMINS